MRISRRTALALAASLPLAGPAHAAEPRRFEVVQHDAGDRVIATVDMDDTYRLTIVTVVPDRDPWLRDLVRQTNDKPVLHIDAVPAAGQPRFAQASRIVTRAEPSFADALRDELRRYYGIELR